MPQPMTKADVITTAKRLLGEPWVRVELDPENDDVIYASAERWYVGRKGQTRMVDVSFVSGQQQYPMPEDCDTVIDIDFPPTAMEGVRGVFDDVGLGLSGVPIDYTYRSGRPGTYSGYAQMLISNEIGNEIIGTPPHAEYNRLTNTILVMGDMPSGSVLRVKYKSKEVHLPSLEMMDFEVFIKYVLAEMKCVLGRILRKHTEIPGAAGPKVVDGDALAQEGREEKQTLDERIRDLNGPSGFFMG